MQYQLNASDIIEIVGIIASLVTSIVAIVISVKTLKQNSQMIEESSRPYVAVYPEYIQVLSTPHEYLVIKNFGSTGATIDSLVIDPPFEKSDICNDPGFTHISGTFIAPNQAISTTVFANAFNNNRTGITTISIKYHSDTKKYCESFYLNEDLQKDIRFTKPVPAKNRSLEEIISKATEELLRRNL